MQGRDKGTALELRVSIALAHLLKDRATSADETGAALNDLGISLQTLAERDSGTDRLEQAVDAYRDALKEYTRDRVPLGWAETQFNLAITHHALFDKTKDAEHLKTAQSLALSAIEVFEAAGAEHHMSVAQNGIDKINAALSSL